MKYIFTLAICFVTLFSCNSAKDTNESEKTNITNKVMKPLPTQLQMETVTRGFYSNIVITNGVATVKKNRNEVGTNVKLTAEELKDLKVAFNQFELESVNEILSPSNKRFSDASPASSIKIINDGKEYVSNDFDTNNPPTEFVALVKFFNNIIPK